MKYVRLLTVLLTLYYYSCLFSFSPLAPSPLSITIPEVGANSQTGKWGAILSGIALYYLGVGAYILPAIPMCFASLHAFKIKMKVSFLNFLLSSTLLAVSLGQALEITMPIVFLKGYPISTAGAIGSNINIWTEYYFGSYGSYGIIGLCSAFAIVILFSNRDLKISKMLPLIQKNREEKELSTYES